MPGHNYSVDFETSVVDNKARCVAMQCNGNIIGRVYAQDSTVVGQIQNLYLHGYMSKFTVIISYTYILSKCLCVSVYYSQLG